MNGGAEGHSSMFSLKECLANARPFGRKMDLSPPGA